MPLAALLGGDVGGVEAARGFIAGACGQVAGEQPGEDGLLGFDGFEVHAIGGQSVAIRGGFGRGGTI